MKASLLPSGNYRVVVAAGYDEKGKRKKIGRAHV